MLSFILHIRKDNDDRETNLRLIYEYYCKHFPTAEFVIVEDDTQPHFQSWGGKTNSKYAFLWNYGPYNKCKAYNIGMSLASNQTVCFLDIDCVVKKDNILQACEHTKQCGISVGYNGVAIYLKSTIKEQYKNKPIIYDELYDSVSPNLKLNIGFETNELLVGNTKAVGGCLIGKKSTFRDIGGFNPNFNGWGFEDWEIIKRSIILGVPISWISNLPNDVLFHFPHGDLTKDKSDHLDYIRNKKEYDKIVSMSPNDIREYIKTW